MDNKLNLDGRPDVKYHGSTVYASNKVFDSTHKALKTEDGFKPILELPNTIIGIKVTNYDIIIFTNSDTFDTIGYYNFNSDVYTEVIRSEYLNFNDTNLIHAISYYNYKNEILVNWVDGVTDTSNNIRSINLMNLPFNVTGALELVTPSEINLLNIKPNVTIPNIDLIQIGNQGNIKTGGYIIFVKYVYQDLKETDWLNSSNPVTVYSETFDRTDPTSRDYFLVTGNEPDYVTNKSIHFKITNIDVTVKYLKIGIVFSNGLAKTAFEQIVQVGNTTVDVNITTLETLPTTSLENLFVPTANYTKADSIAAFQNEAIYGYPITHKEIKIQKFINNITTEWFTDIDATYARSTDDIDGVTTFKDGVMSYYNKTFIPSEVTAVYLRVFYKDGSVMGDYHIPGREVKVLDVRTNGTEVTERALIRTAGTVILTNDEISETSGVNPGFEDGLENDISLNDDVRYYQTRNTASLTTANTGDMGYWENANETYEDDAQWDIWEVDGSGNPVNTGTTLRNKNVRHHRFPSQLFIKDNSLMADDNISKPVLGIKLSNVVFPTDIANIIGGYKIMYAVRTGLNNTVQDESIVHYTTVKDNQCDSEVKRSFQETHNWASYSGTTPVRNNEYVLRPFTTINNNNPILADYLLTNYLVRSTNGSQYYYYDDTIVKPDDNINFLRSRGIPLTSKTLSSNIVETTSSLSIKDNLKVIDLAEYIPRNAIINNVDNSKGDTVIYVKTKQLDGSDFLIPNETDTSGTNSGWYRAVSMMMYKEDCYISFNNQLIARGSDFIPYTFNTLYTAGGDSFIGIHSYRLTYQYCYGASITHGRYTNFILPSYSQTNVELRHTIKYAFYPNLSNRSISYEDYLKQNYFKYNPTLVNPDFNIINNLSVARIFNTNNNIIFEFPYRYLISNINNSESLANNWDTIKFNSYRDTDITKGFITSLTASDTTLYIQKRDSLYALQLRDVLNVAQEDTVGTNSNNVYNASMREVVVSDINGYIGSGESFGHVLTKYGYCVIDTDKQKVFLVNGTKATDISIGAYDYLHTFSTAFKDSHNNPVLSTGIVMAYNDIDEMLLISFADGNCEPETQDCSGDHARIAKRFTLSYSFVNQGWLSFHKYLPNLSDYNRHNLFTIKDNIIYQHNDKVTSCTYYKNDYNDEYKVHDDIVDYLFNSLLNQDGRYYGASQVKIFDSFIIDADIIDFNDNYIYDRQDDKVVVYNDTQCTGEVTTKRNSWFDNTGYRIVNSKGYFNKLTDIVKNDTNKFLNFDFELIQSNLGGRNFFELSNFISKFIVLRLIHINSDKAIAEKIFTINVDSSFNTITNNFKIK